MSTSSSAPCPRCERDGYFLPFLSKYAPVNYFRCDRCAHVWGLPKGESELVGEILGDEAHLKANA
jgi:hypothetical protein